MAKTFAQYFQQAFDGEAEEKLPGYLRQHYDVSGFCSGSLSRDLMGRNIIGRMRNNFIEAVKNQVLMLKMVIIILENDLIAAANHSIKGESHVLGPCIDWLAAELHKISTAHKEQLPSKSCKYRYPQLLWVAAVYHDSLRLENLHREKFNACLEDVKSYREMHILKLPTWDRCDYTTFSNGYMNPKGLSRYWNSVNDAVQAWDKEQVRQQQQAVKIVQKKSRPNNRYHWSASAQERRHKLPRPN